MNRFAGIISILVLVLQQIAIAEVNTPQQEFTALIKAYNAVSVGLRHATTDSQRKAAIDRMATFSSRFVELAKKNPSNPVAFAALRQAVQVIGSTDSGAQIVWETNQANFPAGCNDGSTDEIVTLVLRDHLRSDKLGPVIDRMRYSYRLQTERCLSAVLEKNPHRNIRGLACLALAQFLSDRSRMLQLAFDRPELVKCYAIVFGKDYYAQLQQLGRGNLDSRIEKLLERAANEYGDVKFRNSTVGEVVKSEQYERQQLSIGKIAPNMQGKDQHGKRFNLTDYRGKVVLLYFWSEY